jgi:6-phosphogluconolactonase
MIEPLPRVTIFTDPLQLASAGAREFYARALRAQAGYRIFTCGLSGGTTPRTLFSQIAVQNESRRLPAGFWNSVHFFWGDEREVPPDHPDSNYRLARDELFQKLAIPPDNIHRIRPENGGASAAAEEYERELRRFFDAGTDAVPRFDLIFLGLGEDGHAASLFPGSSALQESKRWVTAAWVERLGTSRVTMTLPVLNHAACVIFLVSGKGKAQILRRVLCRNPGEDRLPAQAILPVSGELLWFVDRAAASDLPPTDASIEK